MTDLAAVAMGFGCYVHVPFCAARCDYCAFATWVGREADIDRYVAAVVGELDEAQSAPWWRAPDTVFLGGGTPSVLSAADVARVLRAAAPAPGAEVTIECNPEHVTPAFVDGVLAAGVTRVSLGVQSIHSHVLAGLGRAAGEGATGAAVRALGDAGVANYSVDLIYGGAGETAEDFAATVAAVVGADHPPAHVSAYALTVEPGTPLSRAPERHPDDDDAAEKYVIADEMLRAAGYEWYEISNWSRPGRECRHNLSCWLGGDFVGVGCAAHGHIEGARVANVRSLDRYLDRRARGLSARATSERLDARGRLVERLELCLRTRVGVPSCALDDSARAAGLVRDDGVTAVLTRRGRLLANEVALRLDVDAAVTDGRAAAWPFSSWR